MHVPTFETCWAVNSEIIKQVTSSWSIFIQLSLMMHGPINISYVICSLSLQFYPSVLKFLTNFQSQHLTVWQCWVGPSVFEVQLQLLLTRRFALIGSIWKFRSYWHRILAFACLWPSVSDIMQCELSPNVCPHDKELFAGRPCNNFSWKRIYPGLS